LLLSYSKFTTKPCFQPLPANTNSNLKKEKHSSFYKQIYPTQTLLSQKQSNGKMNPFQKIGFLKVQHHQNYPNHLNPMSKLKTLPSTQMAKSNCLSIDTLQVLDSRKTLLLPVQYIWEGFLKSLLLLISLITQTLLENLHLISLLLVSKMHIILQIYQNLFIQTLSNHLLQLHQLFQLLLKTSKTS